MEKEEEKKLFDSLKQAKENNFKSSLDDNPEAKKVVLVGQLRSLKFARLGLMERRNLQGEQADLDLDKYNKQREKLIKDIKDAGFEYIEGEEDDEIYNRFEM